MLKFFLGFIFFVIVQKGISRPYNYMDVPVGERAFGMGHVSMAVPGDVGNTLYNPAILADLNSNQVSASLSGYARIDTRTGEFVSIFKSAKDNISRGGFLAIPSMVGGNVKWGRWNWGGSVLVPDSFQSSGNVEINDTDTGVFESSFQSVYLGLFAARKWGSHGFGISVFYMSRAEDEKFFYFLGNSGTDIIRFIQRGYSVNGVNAIIGGSYSYDEDWRLGYSLRLPSWAWGGTAEYVDALSGTTTGFSGTQTTKSKFFPVPLRASLGISYEPSSRWNFGADLHFFSGINGNYDSENANPVFVHNAKSVVNFGIGAEYFVFKELALRLGAYTNMSAAKTSGDFLSAIYDKVHMFGGTAAIVFDKSQGSISIGGFIQGGQGRSLALNLSNEVVPRSNYIYGAMVGSSYRF
jgi:hypothetical protein